MQLYDKTNSTSPIDFIYPNFEDSIFFTLREKTKISIDRLSEIDAVKKICGYVHNLFPHDGYSTPSSYDPITILEEARQGKSFRCVEYSILGTSLLWAYGIHARVIGLKTKDCETQESGAGHVVLEFWSKQFQKWIVVDVQMAILMQTKHIYLSAFELLESIQDKKEIVFDVLPDCRISKEEIKEKYVSFITHHLFFFDTSIETIFSKEKIIERNTALVMLIPLGVEAPKIFQNIIPITVAVQTCSVLDFYPKIK